MHITISVNAIKLSRFVHYHCCCTLCRWFFFIVSSVQLRDIIFFISFCHLLACDVNFADYSWNCIVFFFQWYFSTSSQMLFQSSSSAMITKYGYACQNWPLFNKKSAIYYFLSTLCERFWFGLIFLLYCLSFYDFQLLLLTFIHFLGFRYPNVDTKKRFF